MKNIGPFLNRDLGYRDQPRSLFSNMPIGADFLVDYHMFFDDFIGTAVNATDTYTVIKDTSATVTFGGDDENGSVKITSAATTDDDGGSIQLAETSFLVKSGKKLWFEAKVKVADADQCDMFIGLCDNFATNPENSVAAGQARIGFELVDGSAVIQASVDDDTTTTRTSTGISASDDTYVRLGFRTEGGSIRFYVNRALVATVAIPSAIAAVTLGPTFFGLSGNATGTHTRQCDYILVVQER